MSVSPDTISSALRWRYAVKQFDPSRKLSDTDWAILSDSLHLSPSSYGLQPWKFLNIQTPAIRTQLRAVSWGQSQIEDASHLVVFTARRSVDEAYVDAYLNRIVDVRGVPVESLAGYRSAILAKSSQPAEVVQPWAQRQTYIAMGMLLSTAALIGVDTCAIEGLSPSDYDAILGLTDSDYGTIAAVALGYRATTDKYSLAAKVRFPKESIIETI